MKAKFACYFILVLLVFFMSCTTLPVTETKQVELSSLINTDLPLSDDLKVNVNNVNMHNVNGKYLLTSFDIQFTNISKTNITLDFSKAQIIYSLPDSKSEVYDTLYLVSQHNAGQPARSIIVLSDGVYGDTFAPMLRNYFIGVSSSNKNLDAYEHRPISNPIKLIFPYQKDNSSALTYVISFRDKEI